MAAVSRQWRNDSKRIPDHRSGVATGMPQRCAANLWARCGRFCNDSICATVAYDGNAPATLEPRDIMKNIFLYFADLRNINCAR
jgi:hypothetical protein